MKNFWMKLRTREEGAGLVEYALLLVLISIASIAIMTTLGTTIGRACSNGGNRRSDRRGPSGKNSCPRDEMARCVG